MLFAFCIDEDGGDENLQKDAFCCHTPILSLRGIIMKW